jgi:predicted dehydrogenase
MVKVGLIGIGFMGNMHFGCYRDNPKAQIVAIADINKKKLSGDWSDIVGNIAGGAGKVDLTGIRTYDSAEKLIGDADIEYVDICLPTYMHPKHAIMALEAGKHVLCEKPIALTVKDADRMIAAAKKARRNLMIGQCIRFWPEWAWLKDVIKKKKYGRVMSVHFSRLSPLPTWGWKNWLAQAQYSGGAAVDLHIHDTDFVCYVFGVPKKVTSVAAKGPTGGYDHIETTYHYANNIKITADGGWEGHAAFPFRMAYQVFCQNATIEYDCRLDPPLGIYLKDGSVRTGTDEKIPATDGYHAEINYYVDCIAAKRKPTLCRPEDARTSLAVIHKEIASAERNATVAIKR